MWLLGGCCHCMWVGKIYFGLQLRQSQVLIPLKEQNEVFVNGALHWNQRTIAKGLLTSSSRQKSKDVNQFQWKVRAWNGTEQLGGGGVQGFWKLLRCEEAFLEKRDSVWQKVAGLLNQSWMLAPLICSRIQYQHISGSMSGFLFIF